MGKKSEKHIEKPIGIPKAPNKRIVVKDHNAAN